MKQPKYTAEQIADYFLSIASLYEDGDLISNLKLQKLVYYAQGFALPILGRPLFSEPLEAWTHGPVVPSLYRKYKQYGSGPIPAQENFSTDNFDEETLDLLHEVYEAFGQFSAWRLRDMTHEEAPWKVSYENDDRTIDIESLSEYFSGRVAN